ncbi:uncharacterized protein LOC134854705 [Symsagittifera roscoffensis]|uniref:uncharacterized protein LOC134854705 n=1 Tax=Symsagittifera roscoffensis TaxID=84072 RepID=UPI00307BB711
MALYMVQYSPNSQLVDSAAENNERIRTLDLFYIKSFFVFCTAREEGGDPTKNPHWTTSVALVSAAQFFLAFPVQMLRVITISDIVGNAFLNKRSFRKILVCFYLVCSPFMLMGTNLFWITSHMLNLICYTFLSAFACVSCFIFFAFGLYSKMVFFVVMLKGKRMNICEMMLLFQAKWILTIIVFPTAAIFLCLVDKGVCNFLLLLKSSDSTYAGILFFQIFCFLLPLGLLLVAKGVNRDHSYQKEPDSQHH